MSRSSHVLPIHALRRQRRWLAAALLGGAALWTVLSFAQCLTAPASSMAPMTQPVADATASDVCCPPALCVASTYQNMLPGDAAVPPSAGVKLWFVALFAVATRLVAVTAPRKVSLPAHPLLPKRPRTLKFYALRI